MTTARQGPDRLAVAAGVAKLLGYGGQLVDELLDVLDMLEGRTRPGRLILRCGEIGVLARHSGCDTSVCILHAVAGVHQQCLLEGWLNTVLSGEGGYVCSIGSKAMLLAIPPVCHVVCWTLLRPDEELVHTVFTLCKRGRLAARMAVMRGREAAFAPPGRAFP